MDNKKNSIPPKNQQPKKKGEGHVKTHNVETASKEENRTGARPRTYPKTKEHPYSTRKSKSHTTQAGTSTSKKIIRIQTQPPTTQRGTSEFEKISKTQTQESQSSKKLEHSTSEKFSKQQPMLATSQQSQSSKKGKHSTFRKKSNTNSSNMQWGTTKRMWQTRNLPTHSTSDMRPHILGNLPPYDNYSCVVNLPVPFITSTITKPTNTNFQTPYKSYSSVVSGQYLQNQEFKDIPTTSDYYHFKTTSRTGSNIVNTKNNPPPHYDNGSAITSNHSTTTVPLYQLRSTNSNMQQCPSSYLFPPNTQAATNYQAMYNPHLPLPQQLPPYEVIPNTATISNHPGANRNQNYYQNPSVNCPLPAQYVNQPQFCNTNVIPAPRDFSLSHHFQSNVANPPNLALHQYNENMPTNIGMKSFSYPTLPNHELQQLHTNADNQQPLVDQQPTHESHPTMQPPSQPIIQNLNNIPEEPRAIISLQTLRQICPHFGMLFPPVPFLPCCSAAYKYFCPKCQHCIEFVRAIVAELNRCHSLVTGNLKWGSVHDIVANKSHIINITRILTNRMLLLSHVYPRPRNGIQHQEWCNEIQVSLVQFLIKQEELGHTMNHNNILFALLSSRIGYLPIWERLRLSMFDSDTVERHKKKQMSVDAYRLAQNYNTSMQAPGNYNINMHQPHNMHLNQPQNNNNNESQPHNYNVYLNHNNTYIDQTGNYHPQYFPKTNQHFATNTALPHTSENQASSNVIVDAIKMSMNLPNTESRM